MAGLRRWNKLWNLFPMSRVDDGAHSFGESATRFRASAAKVIER
jgi:hypothetical protein